MVAGEIVHDARQIDLVLYIKIWQAASAFTTGLWYSMLADEQRRSGRKVEEVSSYMTLCREVAEIIHKRAACSQEDCLL